MAPSLTGTRLVLVLGIVQRGSLCASTTNFTLSEVRGGWAHHCISRGPEWVALRFRAPQIHEFDLIGENVNPMLMR